jgi:hypothetical protein
MLETASHRGKTEKYQLSPSGDRGMTSGGKHEDEEENTGK